MTTNEQKMDKRQKSCLLKRFTQLLRVKKFPSGHRNAVKRVWLVDSTLACRSSLGS